MHRGAWWALVHILLAVARVHNGKSQSPLSSVFSGNSENMGSSDTLFFTEMFLSPAQSHALSLEAVLASLFFSLGLQTDFRFNRVSLPALFMFDLPNASQPRAQYLRLPC